MSPSIGTKWLKHSTFISRNKPISRMLLKSRDVKKNIWNNEYPKKNLEMEMKKKYLR